jgi:peptidoglycan/xylan/chitin deacetylase (PgdA/CDA1 family)
LHSCLSSSCEKESLKKILSVCLDIRKLSISKKELVLGALTGLCFLVVFILIVFVLEHYQQVHTKATTPVLETNRTMVKKLPPAIKKQLAIASPSATFRVPILLYHYVENIQNPKDKLRVELNVTPSIFEQQIITLKNAGYTFMTAKELGEVLDGKMSMPEKPILLTFDDGHWDFATDVLPILEKYHVVATSYIITGFIGGSDFMTSQELQEVIDSGLVDVGAHTVHHISLANRQLITVQNEVDQSKKTLEQDYHISVVSFAYPNGSFDQQAAQVVRDDGFSTAVSTVPGVEQNQANRFFMYRLRPGYRTGDALLTWLSQTKFAAY